MNQSDLHWRERKRFGKGDTSQTQFRLWAERNGIKVLALGFDLTPEQDNDISATRFLKLNPQVRMAPDYACMGKDEGFLVEVKGCGSEGVKIKQETLDSLSVWQAHMQDVYFFVYNSSTKACTLVPYEEIKALCSKATPKYFKSDRKKFYPLPNRLLTWEKVGEKNES